MGNLFQYFKQIKFKLSDLFLFLWIVLGSIITIEENNIRTFRTNETNPFLMPFFLYVMIFVLMIISLISYLFLERKSQSRLKLIIIFISSFYLITSEMITIFLSPNIVSLQMVDIYNGFFTLKLELTNQIKFIHFISLFFNVATIVIMVFFFSKRFKDINTILLVIYLVYLAAFILFIISLINDNYTLYFKIVFKIEESIALKDVAPVSVFGNPNLYAMFIEVCLFTSFLHFSISHKKYCLIIFTLFFIQLLITLCKASILSTSISFILYLVSRAYFAIKHKNKKSIIIYSSLVLAIIAISISLIMGAYSLNLLENIDSFTGRTVIWSAVDQIINSNSIIFGTGYGIYNSLITETCIHYEITPSSITHNWALALVGHGGIICLVSYLLLLSFGIKEVLKNIKKTKYLSECSIALMGFFIHSFFEDNYYLVIGAVTLSLIIININTHSNDSEEKQAF